MVAIERPARLKTQPRRDPKVHTKVKRFSQGRIDRASSSGLLSVTPMRKFRLMHLACRRHRLAAGLAVLLVVVAAPSLRAMGVGERHETRHLIDQLEEQWRSAILNRNAAAADALLSDDFMAITANGMLQTKEETIANLRSGAVRFNSIDISDRKVRFYGSTAIVTSRAQVSGTGPNGDFSGNYRYTHVYVRDATGKWRIVSFEASRVRQVKQHK